MQQNEPPENHPKNIANRYRVEHIIGRGGMAVVYKVRDFVTDRRIALKQLALKSSATKQKNVIELFEREFHTLSQLSHPGIIEVYDYGIDSTGHYYTMELLDGGDLRDLSPLDWQEACARFIDVCSAISLLHSRRMVHRDLTPGNIRCTGDGQAKLLDFGAMIAMGPCKQVVGTASYVSPEVLNQQTVDGRADLYSLGATLYFTLTGRNAFPAKDFSQLRNRWRFKPPPPSQIVKEIPKALDSLVMSLIHLDPNARPANAAEVMERLSALLGLEIEEHLLVPQAYLSTPTLVGREQPLKRLRKKLIRAQQRRGATLVLQGASGVGRSRLVDACALEGKLMGAAVLHTDATVAQSGDYGVVQTLISQLLEAATETDLSAYKERAAILDHLLPEHLAEPKQSNSQNSEATAPSRALLQETLGEWLFEVSKNRTLLIAVDDIHRIDEPSAAFIAYLSLKAAKHSVITVVSYEGSEGVSSNNTLKLLVDTGKEIELENLGIEDTEKLLTSVFGDVPNIGHLTDRVYRISEGNPRDVMQLAQHLVDKKRVFYQSGAWMLPDRIDTNDLPENMAQAHHSRIAALSTDARALVDVMALSSEHGYSLEDFLGLFEQQSHSRLIQILHELVTADVLRDDKESYTFSQQGFVTAIKSELTPSQEKEYHLRLAKMYERREGEDFRVAQHLLRAGESDRGFDLLVAFSERSSQLTEQDSTAASRLIQSLPSGWFDTYRETIQLGKQLDRPAKQVYSLQRRWCSLVFLYGKEQTTDIIALLQQLSKHSGLAYYHEGDDSLDPVARITRAIEAAQERYENSPEDERILEPAVAIRELAHLIIEIVGMLGATFDYAFWKAIPSLKPLTPLSPALVVVDKLARAIGNRIAARNELACKEYRDLLERIAQPDGAGLSETHQEYTRCGVVRGIAIAEAAMGLDTALEFAEQLEKYPTFEVNSMEIRMLYYLWQGDNKKAKLFRRKTELLKIQKGSIQLYEGSQLARELMAHALADDLTGVKRLTRALETMAAKYSAWKPTLMLAQGEYQRIRGDYASALQELEYATNATESGRHPNWADIVGARLRTLIEMGQHDQALSLGRNAVEAAEKAKLGYMVNYIKMPLAVAEAITGEYERAISDAEAVIQSFESMGATGINLGLAYEVRAKVANCMKDRTVFRRYVDLCAEQYCTYGNPALTARYEKLVQSPADPLIRFPKQPDISVANRTLDSSVLDRLATCQTAEERAQCVLNIILEETSATEGFLYTMQKQGPVLSAVVGSHRPTGELDQVVRDYLSAEIDETSDVTKTAFDEESSSRTTTAWTYNDARQYRPLVLGHHTLDGYAITGLAVISFGDADQMLFPTNTIISLSTELLRSGDTELHLSMFGTSSKERSI